MEPYLLCLDEKQKSTEKSQYSNFHGYKFDKYKINLQKIYMIAQQRNFVLKKLKITLESASQKQIALVVHDYSQLSTYSNKSVNLKNIISSALVRAFEEKDQMIGYQFSKQQNEQVTLTIIIASPFLQNITENIVLKKVRSISENEAKLFQLDKLQTKLKKVKQSDNHCKFYSVREQAKYQSNYNNYNEEYDDDDYGNQEGYEFSQLASIKVKGKGKYMVTFSAFVKNIAGQYFYIYQNRDYNKPIFSNSCIMFQQSNVYYNLAFTYVTTIEADSLSFQVYDTADYPCQLKNVVITAESLDKKVDKQ